MKQLVFNYLLTVPAGKEVTYGQIAAAIGRPGAARAVGNILHRNPDPEKYPCYKAVTAAGRLAGNFAFGGAIGQQKLLEAEGIEVAGGRVNLSRYGWKADGKSTFSPNSL
jgi:O-6-methylguanine DNA methyltransferase